MLMATNPNAAREHWAVPERFTYPFVKPRLPSLQRLEKYFDISRKYGFFSNFGPIATKFENLQNLDFREKRSVAAANCTVGLSAALMALGVRGPVLVPAFTFAATYSAVRATGLAVVLGDVDSRTGVLRADSVDRLARAGRCGAVIAVRPYGIWSDLSDVSQACARAGIPLIVDGAAALGVTRDVVHRFTVPNSIEVFSLHATKPFGVGEGGLIVAPARFEDDLRSSLNFGLWADGKVPRGTGFNGKMDELTSAMACTVLEDIPQRIGERQACAARFNAWAGEDRLETFCKPGDEDVAPWQCFPVRLPPGKNPDRVVAACANAGLQIRRYYHPVGPAAIEEHLFPASSQLSGRTVCLPVYDGPDAELAQEIWSIFRNAVRRA